MGKSDRVRAVPERGDDMGPTMICNSFIELLELPYALTLKRGWSFTRVLDLLKVGNDCFQAIYFS